MQGYSGVDRRENFVILLWQSVPDPTIKLPKTDANPNEIDLSQVDSSVLLMHHDPGSIVDPDPDHS